MITRRPILAGLAALCAIPAIAAAAPPVANAAPVITMLGDSITAGYGLNAKDALPARLQDALTAQGLKATVRAAGVSGDTTAAGLARLDFSVQKDTTLCVVELGGNDYLQSVDPSRIAANLTTIAMRLKARGIPVVILAGHTPAGSSGAYGRKFAAAFATAAKQTGATLLPDFLDGILDTPRLRQGDGIHPNAEGAKVLADRLAPTIARLVHARKV